MSATEDLFTLDEIKSLLTIKDEKNDSIPRTPAERKIDKETNAWLRRAEKKARDKGRKR